MAKKVFLTLFPLTYWLCIAAGIALGFLDDEFSSLSNSFINCGIFLLAVKLAIIFHEIGHILAAKLVGGTPRRMTLGKGHELHRTQLYGIHVVINSTFHGGLVNAAFTGPGFLRLRYAFYMLGGVLCNGLIAFVLYSLFGLNFFGADDKIIFAPASAFILANALLLVNLLPFYVAFMGVRIPSDGLALLTLPFVKRKEVEKWLKVDVLWDAQEHLERKEYSEALAIYEQYLSQYPENKTIRLTIASVLIKTGEPQKGLDTLLPLESSLHEKELKRLAGHFYNTAAWIYLLLNKIDLANHYSALALQKVPGENMFRGTRGSVLIESGNIKDGILLLSHSMDFNFTNSTTLTAAIYLMLAQHLKGNSSERDKYLNFVNLNYDKLDVDERLLFERNLEKTKLEVISQ
ncbi:MAG TPA: site-2 protease family protein [Chryseolinea sp.]